MSVSQLHSWWLFLSQLGENLFFQLWPTSNIKSHFATTWKNNDISKTLWNFWIISFLISSEWCLQILYNLPPGCQKKFLTKSSILEYWDRKWFYIFQCCTLLPCEAPRSRKSDTTIRPRCNISNWPKYFKQIPIIFSENPFFMMQNQFF